MKIEKLAPNLIVRDVQKSLSFYEALSFKLAMHVPEQPPYVFASVVAGDAEIFLNDQKAAQEMPAMQGKIGGTLTLYIKVTGIKEALAQVERMGAKIVMPLTVQFYGMQEFAFQDPDGWILMYAEPVG